MDPTAISHIGEKAGQTATARGWLYNRRSSGKIQFLIVRDGTGYLQAVVVKSEVDPAVWDTAEQAAQECSLSVTGLIREEKRAPDGDAGRDPRPVGELPDHAQGARRRFPDGVAAPLDALRPAARRPARALGDRAGDPGLLLPPRVHFDRFAHPDGLLRRRDVDPLRDRLLRRQGVPLAVGAVVPRAGGRGLREGLLFRPDVPRGKVEDAAAPDRVLDDRAGGRLPRVRRPLRARRRLRRRAARSGARAVQGRLEAPRARHVEALGCDEALPPHHLPATTWARTRRRRSRPTPGSP